MKLKTKKCQLLQDSVSAFCVFLGNLPRKEKLSALLGWRMVYSIMQVLAAERSMIGEVPRKAALGGRVWHPSDLKKECAGC